MAMPKREPTKVVRVPLALAPLFLRISALHKAGANDAVSVIDTETQRFHASLVKKVGKLQGV